MTHVWFASESEALFAMLSPNTAEESDEWSRTPREKKDVILEHNSRQPHPRFKPA
jgi:hypothetical protein